MSGDVTLSVSFADPVPAGATIRMPDGSERAFREGETIAGIAYACGARYVRCTYAALGRGAKLERIDLLSEIPFERMDLISEVPE